MAQTLSDALEVAHSLADGKRLSSSRNAEWDASADREALDTLVTIDASPVFGR